LYVRLIKRKYPKDIQQYCKNSAHQACEHIASTPIAERITQAMRSIEYRAWNKKKQQMCNVLRIDFWRPVPNGGLEPCACQLLHKGKADIVVIEDIELIQYTGLKDKNDRKIFEGDIIGIKDATAKVVFWERPPEFGLDFSHNEDKWCEDWNLSDDGERMEIIGNVYEHPELLEQKG
jgi:uncharacterized phage protein (TIGR01671 family)